jgi:hypothetical protein
MILQDIVKVRKSRRERLIRTQAERVSILRQDLVGKMITAVIETRNRRIGT